jgi:uncharacterized protein (TIGR02996 family)
MSSEEEPRRGFLEKISLFLSLLFFGKEMPLKVAAQAAAPPGLWLEKIIANPDDDALRLEYAKWLTSQGDILGEFVECEVLQSQIDDTHPEYYSREWRRARLRSERYDGSRTRTETWTAPARACTYFGSTDRGLLENLSVEDVDDFRRRERELVSAIPLLRNLHFFRNGATDLFRNLARCKIASQIRSLDLYDCYVSQDSFAVLQQADMFPNLQTLHCGASRLDCDGLRQFLATGVKKRLESLEIPACKLTDAQGKEVTEIDFAESPYKPLFENTGLAAIRNVSMSAPIFDERHADQLAHSSLLQRLTELNLSGCPVGGNWMSIASKANYRLPLRRLAFDQSNLGGENALDFSAFPQLCDLNVDSSKVTAAALDQLLRTIPGGLRKLSAAYNAIGDTGAEKISECSQLKNLRGLYLFGCDIGSHGIEHLARSPHLKALVALKLGWNKIGSKAIHDLVGSPIARSLRFLHVCDCGIGEAGAQAVANAPELRNLNWLNVDDNQIGDAGIRGILNSPHLKNLTALSADNCDQREDELGAIWKKRFGNFDRWSAFSIVGKLR